MHSMRESDTAGLGAPMKGLVLFTVLTCMQWKARRCWGTDVHVMPVLRCLEVLHQACSGMAHLPRVPQWMRRSADT